MSPIKFVERTSVVYALCSCELAMPVVIPREECPMMLLPTEDDSDELRDVGGNEAEPAEEGDMDNEWSALAADPPLMVLPYCITWGDRPDGSLLIVPPPTKSKSFGSRSGLTSRVRVCQT